ncbi:hypothetical protein MKY34_08920 [Sporosarcina sp. FSL K6-1522]|uniref:hypothetical protein n=1 Tax=Sporosarcina sp. FSL K6-1522 TaxID=2921554 RepID=UPI00315AF308
MNALLMPFLYFPEDKSEYIPAAFSMLFFGILLVLAYRWILRTSKKQELATKELEERILRERREAKEKQHPQQ